MSAETLETASIRKRAKRQGTILLDQVEQFALLKRPNLQQIKNLKEVFYALAKSADTEQRRRMSILLNRSPYAPRSVLLFLSTDLIEISSPIILFSPVLTSRDLCNIIDKTGIGHARVIARRDDIDTRVIEALLEKDDKSQTILNVIKQNVSAKSALENYFNKENKDTRTILLNPPNSTKVSSKALKTTSTEATKRNYKDAGEQLIAVAGRGGKLGKPNYHRSTNQHDDAYGNPGKAIIAAARNPDRHELTQTLKKICGINPRMVRSYIDQGDVGTFACLLSAIDISAAFAGRILLLLFSTLGRDKILFDKVLNQYCQLDKSNTIAFFKKADPGFGVPVTVNRDETGSVPLGLLLQNRRNILQGSNPKPAHTKQNINLVKSG